MGLRPRFVGRLGAADWVTTVNAALGLLAVLAAVRSVELAARLVLLAGIVDAIDGLVARWHGSTPVGEPLDSLADTVSFGVAPAVLLAAATAGSEWAGGRGRVLIGAAVAALYAVAAVVRLALYTAYDAGNDHTVGVPSTLAGTILAAGVLAGVPTWVLALAGGLFAYLMVVEVRYPDLLPRDATLMGAVQAAAALAPLAFGRLFPRVLLAWALAYLLFAPRYYWR
jgi:CDP-diacylglycerol--serine O-phosphatidyltransferase